MRIFCQTFSLPKEGRELTDYEDACFPCNPQSPSSHQVESANVEEFRAAVCDGATDSCFSQYWAQLLASGYGNKEWSDDLTAASIVKAQASWKALLSEQELPWYAQEKAELGAFAAAAGLSLLEREQAWKAVAIGDSCIFHTRNGTLLNAFPLAKSDDFNSFPLLLGSLEERNADVFEQKKTLSGRWENGDNFFLMSDAIACWFLRVTEEGKASELIEWLSTVGSHTAFAQVVETQRQQLNAEGIANMRDDDVTFVRVRVDDGKGPAPVRRATAEIDSLKGGAKSSPSPQPRQSRENAPPAGAPAVQQLPPMASAAPKRERKTMEEIEKKSYEKVVEAAAPGRAAASVGEDTPALPPGKNDSSGKIKTAAIVGALICLAAVGATFMINNNKETETAVPIKQQAGPKPTMTMEDLQSREVEDKLPGKTKKKKKKKTRRDETPPVDASGTGRPAVATPAVTAKPQAATGSTAKPPAAGHAAAAPAAAPPPRTDETSSNKNPDAEPGLPQKPGQAHPSGVHRLSPDQATRLPQSKAPIDGDTAPWKSPGANIGDGLESLPQLKKKRRRAYTTPIERLKPGHDDLDLLPQINRKDESPVEKLRSNVSR